MPSQFSHEILNANPYAYLDDAPLEERRARAVEMRRVLPESVLEEVGRLDPAAIAQVREEAWPDVRDADELHDVLHTLVALPRRIMWGQPPSAVRSAKLDSSVESASSYWNYVHLLSWCWTAEGGCPHVSRRERVAGTFRKACGEGRAGVASIARATLLGRGGAGGCSFSALFPGADFDARARRSRSRRLRRDDALLTLVTGWMSHSGAGNRFAARRIHWVWRPPTLKRLCCGWKPAAPSCGELHWHCSAGGARATRTVERARLTAGAAPTRTPRPNGASAGCWRAFTGLTVATLRKQIEPVTAAQFMRWLLRWQHVAPGTQVMGERGTLEVLRQLQGFEIPANAWERQVLARRIADYDPKWLDQLCLTGAVGWGRLSPHPATLDYPMPQSDEGSAESRRSRRASGA